MSISRVIFNSPLRVPIWIVRFFFAAIKERSSAFLRFHPGYHGSTIPSRKFIEANRDRLFGPHDAFDGIDLNRDEQQMLLHELMKFYSDFNPPENPTAGRLYHSANSMYGFQDAFVLFSMLRRFKPKRVIEVGSGYSSALMLDMSPEFLPDTKFTFIDPYSETIRKVLSSRPDGDYELVRAEVQSIDLKVFQSLGDGDLLLVDTSHAVKIGSDVSSILFRILPSLRPGVLIHIHDIYYPWEYPEEFILEGRTYNELYFIRAFLQFNSAFKIVYNSTQMEFEFSAEFPSDFFELRGVHKRGVSLWLRKLS